MGRKRYKHRVFPYIYGINFVTLLPKDMLSKRKREILFLCGKGLTNVEIGALLFISPKTVETHCEAITIDMGCPKGTRNMKNAICKVGQLGWWPALEAEWADVYPQVMAAAGPLPGVGEHE